MSDGGAFSSGFANAYRMMMDREEKKRQEDNLRQSLEVLSGIKAPLPSDTVNRPVQVQSPTSPIPGQSGLTTQPSAPSSTIPPIQTESQTVEMPVVDPYKQKQKEIEIAYREKMKNLPQIKDPRFAMQFVSQAMQERDLAKAEHNANTFQAGIMEIMTSQNMTPTQKIAKAVQLNGQLKAGFKIPEILKMFEQPKQDLRTVGRSLVRIGADGNPEVLYTDPTQPRGGGNGGSSRLPVVDENGNPVAKPGKPEKVAGSPLDQWAYDYEKKGKYIEDQAIYDAYMNSDFATPEMELKALEAKARLMLYWKMQGNGNPPASRPPLSEIFK